MPWSNAIDHGIIVAAAAAAAEPQQLDSSRVVSCRVSVLVAAQRGAAHLRAACGRQRWGLPMRMSPTSYTPMS
jgi:hypothetical protein